jgi:anti-sigma factor (TIGR02949 family)
MQSWTAGELFTAPDTRWPVTDDQDIDCERAMVALYQFLDGELTVERRARIEFHLNGCPHCFSAFDFEQELRIVVRSCLRSEVPPGLKQRIFEALEQDGRKTGNVGFA